MIELLDDLIVDEFKLPIKDGIIHITEEQNQATCRHIDIKVKKSLPCFCFSIDKHREKGEGDPIFPFFNPQISNICIKNDAILICQKEQQIYVFLIELKSNHPGKNYLKQLKSAQIFIEFIFARIELSEQYKHSLKNIEFRGILFFNRNTPDEGKTKHQKIKFENKNRFNLPVTKQCCNQIYHLTRFLN
ncbi:MAG: hypothetical protein KAH77_07900 [Thiomargarita sp.]|nr:hypothetical protein [Thiomargarita sp.]